MNTRVNRKSSMLVAVLLGGVLAASSPAGAASPWFRPGGSRLDPQGERGRVPERGRERDDDRDGERRRKMYREQIFIRTLYQGFLNRQPSRDEMRDWSERFGRNADPAELVQVFMDSDEFFIRETFRGLLGREPDARGMNSYLKALQQGQSRADVLESVLSSDEFRRRLDSRGPARR